MNVDVALNGRTWKVAVEPGMQPGKFAVSVKGQTRVLDASWIDGYTLSLIDGSSAREVGFDVRGDGQLGVAVDGTRFEVIVSASDAPLKPRPTGAVASRGRTAGRAVDSTTRDFGHAVKAPMPGRVVRVLVALGDRVSARQGVVIVEAMKMENELRSANDGVVKEIRVLPGAAIEAGTVLVVIE